MLERMYSRLRAGADEALSETPARFAYLFGSYARGTAKAGSDVDVAVHLGATPAGLEVQLEIVRRIHQVTGVETEVVILGEAPLRLVERILLEGRLIYSADETARVSYESTMRKLCADFAIHAERLDREMLRATAEGRR